MTNINWLSQRQGCVTKVGNRLKDNELSEITRDGGVSSLSGVEPWRSRMAPAARIGSSRCASRGTKTGTRQLGPSRRKRDRDARLSRVSRERRSGALYSCMRPKRQQSSGVKITRDPFCPIRTACFLYLHMHPVPKDDATLIPKVGTCKKRLITRSAMVKFSIGE